MIIDKIKYVINDMKTYSNIIESQEIKVYLDMMFCMIFYGASPSNYYYFDFYNASFKERKSFLTHRYNEKLIKKYNNKNDIWRLEDKYEFEKEYSYYCKRKCIKNKNITYENFMKYFDEHKIIYKSLRGGQGKNIKTYQVKKDNSKSIFKELINFPEGIIEEWIDQDAKMSSLYSNAINPIRIQTIRLNGKVSIIVATLTIGNNTNIANASAANSIFGLVDITNGTVYTDGYDYNGNCYKEHPMSHIKIKGFVIPNWNDVISLVESIALKIPNLGYIGWDVAITPDGACIIEGNNDAGYLAYQLPMLTKEHRGIKENYKMYL